MPHINVNNIYLVAVFFVQNTVWGMRAFSGNNSLAQGPNSDTITLPVAGFDTTTIWTQAQSYYC